MQVMCRAIRIANYSAVMRETLELLANMPVPSARHLICAVFLAAATLRYVLHTSRIVYQAHIVFAARVTLQ